MEGGAQMTLIGVICGLFSALPYFLVIRKQRREHSLDLVPALVGIGCSLLVMAVSVLLVRALAAEWLLPFGISLFVVFFVAVLASVAWFAHRPRS